MKYVFILLITLNTFAADVQYIEQGTPAPFSGQLFTTKKAKEIRKELLEKDQLKIFTTSLLANEVRYKKIINTQQDQVELLSTQNTKLVKTAEELGTMNNYQKVMWFGVGVVATSLAVIGAGSLIR